MTNKGNEKIFILNLKSYMEIYKVKQKYLSKKTKLSEAKISKLLSNIQEITFTDMDLISKALNREISYFLEGFDYEEVKNELDSKSYKEEVSIHFCMGNPDDITKHGANKVAIFLETLDEVFGVQRDINNYFETSK